MNATLTTGRRLALLVAAAMLLLTVLPTPPADAGTAAVALEGQVTFDQGLGGGHDGSGSFCGTITGVHGTSPRVLVPFCASFSYSGVLIVTGTASGTITIDGDTCGFTWNRVGATTVVTFGGGCTGAAVVVFVPTSVPGSAPSTAVAVGAGAWTH